MSTYKPTTNLDSEGEKGMRPSSGISSSSGLTSSSDAQQQANDGYRAVDERRRNKETASAAIESEADFFEEFGFIIEVTPDDAGRVVFGDNRITIELTPKEVEEADAAEEGTAAPTHPFQLSDASEGATLKVRIKFGMVNSLTPGGMGDVAEPDLILTVTATKYVVLTVTTDSGGIATSAAISLETTVAGDTATSAKQALGLVTYTAAAGAVPASIAFSQVVAGSLRHQMCGGTIHQWGGV